MISLHSMLHTCRQPRLGLPRDGIAGCGGRNCAEGLAPFPVLLTVPVRAGGRGAARSTEVDL